MRRSTLQVLGLVAAATMLTGCSFFARGPDDYRKAVRKVLDSRDKQVESCYKSELKSDDKAQGKVVVKFDVEPKTGNITNPAVVEKSTTASAGLQQCVLKSLEGLKLDPADQRKGEATFVWDFDRR